MSFSRNKAKHKGVLARLGISSVGLVALLVLLVGAVAAYVLTGKSQELRQQASGTNCAAITDMIQCRDTIGCKTEKQTEEFDCGRLTQQQCYSQPYVSKCSPTTISKTAKCRDWQSTGVTNCPSICKAPYFNQCPHSTRLDEIFSYSEFTCVGGSQSYSTTTCVPEAITCRCNNGDQTGASGPATCTRENGSTYQITSRPGCKASSGPTLPTCAAGLDCKHNSVPSGSTQCVAPLDPTFVWNCCPQGMTVVNGQCQAGTNSGTGGGGTGGGGTTTIPTGPRSISGTVRCEAPINGHPTLGTAYPITGLSVQVYEGSLDAPGAVLGTTTTAADGRYTVSNFVLPQGKTRFSVVPSRLTLRDASFVPSGSPDLGCTQGAGYSLCNALNLPIGQTRGNFNFKTTAKASTLGGRNLDGTANYEFSFTMAKDTTGAYIQRYLVKLDRQESPKVWAPGNNTTSDYALYVPCSVGTCSQATGRCTITKAQINSKNSVQMKDGQYTMTISPISASTPGGVAAVELCRNEAYLSVPVRVCGSGLSCVGYFGVQGAQHCLNNNGAPMYCCPAGKTVQGTRCN